MKEQTYNPGNQKTGEQVPERHEEGHDNGRYLMAWSQCNSHHPIQSKVCEACYYEVEEPQELSSLPLEANHSIKDKNVDN